MNKNSRHPNELKPHPLLKTIPELPDDHPDYLKLVDSIADIGITNDIVITDKGLVLCGRHRLRAAKRLQLDTVACKIVEESAVVATILADLNIQRHLTPSQRAYLAAPLMEAAYREAVSRRGKNAAKDKGDQAEIKTIDDLAERIGVGRNLFLDAQKVHNALKDETKRKWGADDEPKTAREYFEPRILASESPMGLGAIVAGLAGKVAPQARGKVRPEAKAETLISEGLHSLSLRFARWEKMKDAARREATKAIHSWAAELPEPVADTLFYALKDRRDKQ